MRGLQELKGEISPLHCIVMQAAVADCKCDPCQEEGSEVAAFRPLRSL